MAQRVLIWRYGAYGDLIYILPLIDRLKERGDTLFLHTGMKGSEIFLADTRFERMTFFEPHFVSNDPEMRDNRIMEVLNEDLAEYKPEVLINLGLCIETSLIPQRGDHNFEWTIEERRKSNPGSTFYTLPLEIGGFAPEIREGECGTVAYLDEELQWAERQRARHEGQFLILLAVAGTTYQKQFPQAESIAGKIIQNYKDAVIYLVSDATTLASRRAAFSAVGENRILIPNPKGKFPFRASLLMARYADFVLGPETGVLVGAGMWGTPKTMLCTTSSVEQATNGHRNDFSLQARIDCSPCMRAIYKPEDCYLSLGEDNLTKCSHQFNEDEILERIDLVYRKLRYRRDADEEIRRQPIRVSEMRPHIVRCPRSEGTVRPEVPGAL